MTCAVLSTGEEIIENLRNENERTYIQIKSNLREKIWEIFKSGINTFWVNCEYGIPLWTAEIICAMKMYNEIKLNIAIPFEEQTTGWEEEIRNRYYNVHKAADDVKMISTHFENKCYENADKYMMNKSNIVLFYGDPKNKKYVCEYTEKTGIPFIQL